jgi:hypothetical protein
MEQNGQIEAKIEEARKAAAGHGDVMLVETDVPGAEVAAFRVPNTMEWMRYRISAQGTPEDKAKSAKPLVCCCCVYPEAKHFEAILDQHPGLVETYFGELLEHAGANRAKKVSKL